MMSTTRTERTPREIVAAAMDLPADERLDLAIGLWRSVHELSDTQETEDDRQATLKMLRERARQLDDGTAEVVPGDEVMRRARARLGS